MESERRQRIMASGRGCGDLRCGCGFRHATSSTSPGPVPGTVNASLAAVPGRSAASFVHAQELQMIDDQNMRPSDNDAERDRVARDMAGRLFTRGIDVRDDDS